MSYTIQQNNVLDWARAYDGEPFHAMLCDPPYHLTDIGRTFQANGNSIDPRTGKERSNSRRGSKGFMGRNWDGGDVAYRHETWAALAQHLYPGAFGMAFASTRGLHRMMVAIEDAGLILHPTIFLWGYGSGFPKATNITARINEDAFQEWLDTYPKYRAELRVIRAQVREHKEKHGYTDRRLVAHYQNRLRAIKEESGLFRAPATDLAAVWEGHRYGGQALKPAVEPIIVFQKPYEGRPVECITRTGAGALWIDGGRVGTDELSQHGRSGDGFGFTTAEPSGRSWSGRWPANLILQHTDRCERIGVRRVRGAKATGAYGTYEPGADGVTWSLNSKTPNRPPIGDEVVDDWRCVPECPVARLGAQSGESSSTDAPRNNGEFKSVAKGRDLPHTTYGHSDTGTAARFFFQADYALERLADADPLYYCAKASRAEREAGLDPRTVAFMRAIEGDDDDTADFPIRGVEELSGGGGFSQEYQTAYQARKSPRRNPHPTVKPLSLARYLATLLLPPDRYAPRRLLVPFSGVSSEMIGAMLAGWEEVLGIELDDDGTHIPVAEARIAYWLQRRAELSDPSRPITVNIASVQDGQLDMFGGGE